MSSTTTSHVITTFDRSYLFIMCECTVCLKFCTMPGARAEACVYTRAPHSSRRNACLSESLNLSQDNVQKPTCLAKQAAYRF